MLIDADKINEAKKKLGDSMAHIIADTLGVENFDPKGLKMCCPWHNEDHASCVWNRKELKFHCFGSCGRNYDIIDAFMKTGKTYVESVQQLFELAGTKYSFGEYGLKTKTAYRYPKEPPADNDKSHVYEYLGLRGISKETIDAADVREDSSGNCVFLFKNTDDVTLTIKYRPSHKVDKTKGEMKSWCQKDADTTPILFNMNRINPSEPLVITEGCIDTLAVIEAGYSNAVSVPFGAGTMTWIEECWDFLEQFNSIIICSDNDEPGIKMRKECVARLGSWRTKYVDIPRSVTTEDGREVIIKDANEVLYHLGKEYLLQLIHNAKEQEIKSVIDASEITELDLDEIDGITTGIKEIDVQLMKLFFGTLTIVSGSPSAGKSSFLSQISCNAMEEGHNVWVYSGELPNWLQKSWINYIFAGRHNIKEYFDANGAQYYKVTPDAKNQINTEYKDKCFIYRDDQSNKLDDLLTSMEECARRKGCKLFLLDNLMTIDIGSTPEWKLSKETECINRLIQFARKYQVAVLLVCHPRKMPAGTDVGMMDISGSMNIINLAHRTLGLARIDQQKEQIDKDVRLTIIKDRFRGKNNTKIEMYYDIPTRRFYTTPDEFRRDYAWDTKDYGNDKIPYPHSDEDEIYGTV